MMTTKREQVLAMLAGEMPDVLPYFDDFWRETRARYQQERRTDSFHDVLNQLGIFIHGTGGLLADAEPGKHTVVSESAECETYVDGNGNTWRRWKDRSGTPEHAAFAVTTQSEWEREIKPKLQSVDKKRYNLENYRDERERARRHGYACYHSARVLISNDCNKVEAELQRVLTPVREGKCRYILHSDHSIPPEVEYGTMEFFFKRGTEIFQKADRCRVSGVGCQG
jgi:hypothetical protein